MLNWFKRTAVLDSFDLEGVANLIKSGKVKNIITLSGAGISTAAGIPDFRSPSCGIYDNLEEFNLPYPMAVFSIDYFQTNPAAFFEVARRMYQPDARPTLTHYFVRLLHEKQLLRRHYTQNCDNLERLSGLPEKKFIEAHGTFNTGHCISCHKEHTFAYMKDEIMRKNVPKCMKLKCGGVVKPGTLQTSITHSLLYSDVVFFGENMPRRFYSSLNADFSACDLLIVMGTSLQVLPFAALIYRVGNNVPRVYLNRECAPDSETGFIPFFMRFMVAGFRRSRFRWNEANNWRDVFVQGNCDESVLKLADLLGWKDELLAMKNTTDAHLSATETDAPSSGR
ncbi:NAD-dependent deacetylase sirtuin 2 [Paragonimus westermani]|uniref:NAD-dependent deacetylase sirtuin 2 n=1 Tax=Paragonimus westermani TaxID=34504 RepID=A0A5J4NL09_9TREM|nr:NAD-dependent deacetylase sirtuin 2 [Paragonimus westermani]